VDKRPLRMRQLSKDEVGIARQNQVYMFSPSPDPYVTVILYVDAKPLLDLIAARREKTGKPITMVHVFNKLLGLAFTAHPEFNSVVLDRRIFELDNVTISNPYLLPGDERALTMLLLEDPQTKSLEQISDVFEQEKEIKRAEFAQFGQNRIGFVPKLYVRSGLFRIISEKIQFKTIYERSLTTNLVLSKANSEDTKNFVATKGGVQILRTFMRFFQHAIIEQAHFEDGRYMPKPVVPLTMVLDHRLIDGYHVNAFIRTINQIVADADNRL
jgi:pyruvate/2-oxoglutarate dehydrogenase complex dihydrolipoamide acyltransferase (E2) component